MITIKEDITKEQVDELIAMTKKLIGVHFETLHPDADMMPHLTMFCAPYPTGELVIHDGCIDPVFMKDREHQQALVHTLGMNALEIKALGLIVCNMGWAVHLQTKDREEVMRRLEEMRKASTVKGKLDLENVPGRTEVLFVQGFFPGFEQVHRAVVTRHPTAPPEVSGWEEVSGPNGETRFLREFEHLIDAVELSAKARVLLNEEQHKEVVSMAREMERELQKENPNYGMGKMVSAKTPEELHEKLQRHIKDDREQSKSHLN